MEHTCVHYNATTCTIITPSIVANTYLFIKLQTLPVKPLLHLRSLASAIALDRIVWYLRVNYVMLSRQLHFRANWKCADSSSLYVLSSYTVVTNQQGEHACNATLCIYITYITIGKCMHCGGEFWQTQVQNPRKVINYLLTGIVRRA